MIALASSFATCIWLVTGWQIITIHYYFYYLSLSPSLSLLLYYYYYLAITITIEVTIAMLNKAYLFVRKNLSISVFSHFSEDSENFGQFSELSV